MPIDAARRFAAGERDRVTSLEALERQVRADIEDLAYPDRRWVIPRRHSSGRHVHNVVILGAGMCGLAAAFGLIVRERVDDVLLIDRAPAGEEGPWVTYARMRTLRTGKEQVGVDAGLPSLTFRRWYAARFGEEAWQRLGKAPNDVWMDYLNWYRRVLALPVENGVEVRSIEPDEGLVWLDVLRDGRSGSILARKLILATGYPGAGGNFVPEAVSANLPRERYAHSADDIDFRRLEGRRVVVIGAAASAFDNAAVALEHGAARVDMLCRRPGLDDRKMMRTLEYSAVKRFWREMPDALRWRFIRHATSGNPPPTESVRRVQEDPRFRLHFGATLERVSLDSGAVLIETPAGMHEADFVIAATGFFMDASARPEFERWKDRILLWRDRYTPPPDERDPAFERAPYLGPAFEMMEKEPGCAPHLPHIHDFSWGSWPSMGPVTAGVSGLQFGLSRLVPGVARALFLEDAEEHYAEARRWTTEDMNRGYRLAGE